MPTLYQKKNREKNDLLLLFISPDFNSKFLVVHTMSNDSLQNIKINGFSIINLLKTIAFVMHE